MKFYVYHLVDPRDGKPFYVGKGQGNRIDFHVAEAKAWRPGRKCHRIREILKAGMSVDARKVGLFASEEEAFAFETEQIKEIGIENLTNVKSRDRVRLPRPEKPIAFTFGKYGPGVRERRFSCEEELEVFLRRQFKRFSFRKEPPVYTVHPVDWVPCKCGPQIPIRVYGIKLRGYESFEGWVNMPVNLGRLA